MSLTISPAAKSVVYGPSHTRATLWEIYKASGGSPIRLTDHNHDLDVHVGEATYTYKSEGMFKTSSMRDVANMGDSTIEIEGTYEAAALTYEDVRQRQFNGQRVVRRLVDFHFLAMGEIGEAKEWTVANVRPGRFKYQMDLIGLSRVLKAEIGNHYERHCRATFGDLNTCSLDKTTAERTKTITVSVVNAQRLTFTFTGDSVADDFFGRGFLTFTSGPNNGRTYSIKRHVEPDRKITLNQPSYADIEVGNTASAVVGCRKRKVTDCKNKHDNLENFRGEPDQPGSRRMLKGP